MRVERDFFKLLNQSGGGHLQRALVRSILGEGAKHSTESIMDWVAGERDSTHVNVELTKFSELSQWEFDSSGHLAHESGGFFRIEGVEVEMNRGPVSKWRQPIINQPEIGILGILTAEIGGTIHALMQAKIEPGNTNVVQISPTLQATRSNYLQKHKGKAPRYLEHFRGDNNAVIVDQLQSEQGARFLRKRNRNVVLFTRHPPSDGGQFRWMTLAQIKEISRLDNMINMDSRTVISGLALNGCREISDALSGASHPISELYRSYMFDPEQGPSLWSLNQIFSWLTHLKTEAECEVSPCSLQVLGEWELSDERITHKTGRYFDVVPVKVTIGNREVTSWDQPMIRPHQDGVCALFYRKIDGVVHFLMQAKMECGNLDLLELAPTIQCLTGSYKAGSVPFVPELEAALESGQGVHVDVMQSEEGGRFYKEQNRNIIYNCGDSIPLDLPNSFIWMSAGQVRNFGRFSHYLNVQTRCLLALL